MNSSLLLDSQLLGVQTSISNTAGRSNRAVKKKPASSSKAKKSTTKKHKESKEDSGIPLRNRKSGLNNTQGISRALNPTK
jgi:hypothetical protein